MHGAEEGTARPSPDEMADHRLLDGLGSGDPVAAAAFVTRFRPRAEATARRVLGDDDLAADVAQQALERVWRMAPRFDPGRGPVGAWMTTITRNLALDELRRRRPIAVDPLDGTVLDRPCPERRPDDQAVVGDELTRVRRALRALPAEQRRAVLLATEHGRSATEIARLEGIPLGTAKTRVRTGLRRLRGRLVGGPAA